MTTKFRRMAAVCLTAVMGTSLAASHTLAFANSKRTELNTTEKVEFENVTDNMDLSSIVLKNLSPSVLKNAGISTEVSKNSQYTVIVGLEEESIIESKDGGQSAKEYISSFAGAKKLKDIQSSQDNFLSVLSKSGIGYTYINGFSTVTNAVAITANYNDLQKISKIKGVKSVVLSSSYAYPEAIKTNANEDVSENDSVYPTGIYNSQQIIDEYGVDGSGMTVAILDTGLDYTHEAFSPDNMEGKTLGLTKDGVESLLSSKNFTSEALSGAKGQNITANDVYVNAKVPFAYDYADSDTDVYPSYSNHGTHVAGIVAGHADWYSDKKGEIAKYADGTVIPFRGVAPYAQLVICKVFTDDFDSKDLGGAVTEDILAALDDCVKLGVDVINMSLGTASGFSSICIDDEEKGLKDTEGMLMNSVYNSIKDAGISLICAASNEFSSGFGSAFGTNLASAPDSGTIGSPSTFDGAMSVASINGQLARYITVETAQGNKPVYYLESSDENSVAYDFLAQMLADGTTTKRLKYVIVPGRGEAADYTTAVQRALKDKSEGPVIAVIKRGKTTFKEKIQIAMEMGADAVIMANNVAGTIRMSLGDLKNPVPSVSVTMDAGTMLTSAATGSIGHVTLDESYKAGPFMNDYSSWGTTADLKLKPDVTAHGGEITSTVPGGYDEQSGTSMASPNFAGFTALLRSYLKGQSAFGNYSSTELTRLTNQVLMSTATIVNDQEELPYSPRKQGAGLATMDNAFGTSAYLSTVEGKDFGAEDNRPKLELGDDKDKKGKYDLTFYANNFGSTDLKFRLQATLMTETLSSDGLSVAEKAHLFTDNKAQWKADGKNYNDGDVITVPAGAHEFKITVTLTLSDAEKKYIDSSFENGMFVEGFLKLESTDEKQCDLSLPFMGFYGDWRKAPMLDYDCFEISKFDQDTSKPDEEKPKAQVWATQAYAEYYNKQYTVPLGSFVYVQDEDADKIYTDEEHCAVSCFNAYNGPEDTSNYLTTTAIKALYAGLLRNAEVVQYNLYDDSTGELLKADNIYRVSKAISNGGSAIPANVKLELDPQELGLVSNGKYRFEFFFYFDADDVGDASKVNEDNTFSMSFYVDYEAPVLTDARVRYYDYKDGNKDKQRIYLDLDIYDNHYAQSAILCYASSEDKSQYQLVLATEYVTPVYNAVKNGITTVSIEITDFYETYKDSLYVQLDDYALNHSIYMLRLSSYNSPSLPGDFSIADGSEITIGVNENRKLKLNYDGSANLSDFTWGSTSERVKVKNGEIFGVAVTDRPVTITVSNGKVSKRISVNVVNKNITLPLPSISFGLIETAGEGLKNASGSVDVYAGREYNLEVKADVWYYPVSDLTLRWTSSNENIAKVDQNGKVTTLGEDGVATITAVIVDGGRDTLYAATVTFNVQDPFKVSNFTLTDYKGPGGKVIIPDDENIMSIGAEAFKDDKTVEYVIIPRTVTEISERAFKGCTNLKGVYFISEKELKPADAKLSLIQANAFENCTSLEFVDFTNNKKISIAKYAFRGCTALSEIKKMSAVGTLYDGAFEGCTSLKEVDLTGLHNVGSGVFANCTSLTVVKTDFYTALGAGMFYGCEGLGSIEINTPAVSDYAFYGCKSLASVKFGGDAARTLNFTVGASAFEGCEALTSVDFGNNGLSRLGDRAFAECKNLKNITLPAGAALGDQIFYNTPATVNYGGDTQTDEYGAVYRGTTLVAAPKTLTADFAIKSGTTEISDYAFSDTSLSGVTSVTVPDTVTKIGEGAFAHLQATEIILSSAITVIPEYAFYGCSNLASITIPASATAIGASAFEGCINLTSINFNDKLVSIGTSAFAFCQKLASVTLPASVTDMGDTVFYGCTALTEANLSALKTLGSNTFGSCFELAAVTFASGATTVGEYTFFPGGEFVGENFRVFKSSLKTVTLPDGITEIPEGLFYYCEALESVNLKNATSAGAYAFANCRKLASVEGLDKLVNIGDFAFSNCFALTALNLAEAVNVGNYAFDMTDGNGSFTGVTLPKVENIGNFAFYGGKQNAVNLPATLKTLGYAAFGQSTGLKNVNVDPSNKNFFSENGVLYRYIRDAATGRTYFELCVYPSAKVTDKFTVKEGTSSIAAYAFASINAGSVNTVVLPYSVKSIGVAAFVDSGIKQYDFESVNAPVLLSEYYDNTYFYNYFVNGLSSNNMTSSDPSHFGTILYFTLFNMNFETNAINFSNIFHSAYRGSSTLKMTYPENGTGYDNYLYSLYFGTAERASEVLDETSRAFKETMDGIIAQYGESVATTVKGWNTLEVNDANKSTVNAFSDTVKEAHRLYNNILKESQLKLLDEGKTEGYYYNLLTSVESELKPVKTRFGIKVQATKLEISPDSTHKTQYKSGETFDLTGLKAIIIYDDYSTVAADSSQIKLSAGYDGALSVFDIYVVVEAQGATVLVPITVEAGDDTETPPEKTGCNGCKSEGGAWGALGALGAVAVAAGILMIVRRKKSH